MEKELKKYVVSVEISGNAEIEVMASSPEEAVAMADSVSPYSGDHELDGYSLRGDWIEKLFSASVINDELNTDCCTWVSEADGNNEWAIENGEVMPCDDDASAT